VVVVELMFEGVGFLGREHGHEFELDADVVLAFNGVKRHFQAEGGVERAKIGESVRLEERVGLDVAVSISLMGQSPRTA
jgi:hypothetical protein